jgi:hypothetical protein
MQNGSRYGIGTPLATFGGPEADVIWGPGLSRKRSQENPASRAERDKGGAPLDLSAGNWLDYPPILSSVLLCSGPMRAYKFLDAKFGLKSLREKRLKISTLPDLNDPFELLPYEMSDRNRRGALRKTRDELAKNRGVLCFSADWRDPVIWAHYSDKHRGLCLGFEIPDRVCQRVEYVARRLQLPTRPTIDDANALLFTKYENWRYEKEIRVWAALNQSDGGLYFADFGKELNLVKVIAGARCSLLESEIVEALGPLAKDVILVKARAGFKEFEIVKDKRGFTKS